MCLVARQLLVFGYTGMIGNFEHLLMRYLRSDKTRELYETSV